MLVEWELLGQKLLIDMRNVLEFHFQLGISEMGW
jgi:hypothetical protein